MLDIITTIFEIATVVGSCSMLVAAASVAVQESFGWKFFSYSALGTLTACYWTTFLTCPSPWTDQAPILTGIAAMGAIVFGFATWMYSGDASLRSTKTFCSVGTVISIIDFIAMLIIWLA